MGFPAPFQKGFMRYLFLLLFLIGCTTVEIIEPTKYFPEGVQGNAHAFYYNGNGEICSKTGEKTYTFKVNSKNEIIGEKYYRESIYGK